MNSLKQDKGHYEEHIVIYNDCVIKKRKYPTSEPIDCFHRLQLSPEALRLLYKLGKLEKKMLREDVENIDELNIDENKLEEQFSRVFENPYELDWEICSEDPDDCISYIFYDNEYDYILEHTRGGWFVWCRHSELWWDGELCEVDEPQ